MLFNEMVKRGAENVAPRTRQISASLETFTQHILEHEIVVSRLTFACRRTEIIWIWVISVRNLTNCILLDQAIKIMWKQKCKFIVTSDEVAQS